MASSSKNSERRRRESRLGLAAVQPRADAERLAASLEALWIATIGPLRDLESDLQLLKRYFDPVATGARLRRDLARLATAPDSARALRAPHVLAVDGERQLLTPEGRAALSIVRDALLRGDDPVLVADRDVVDVERRLLDVYREWSRHRILQVLALQSGTSKPMQVPAIGLLITLLISRIDVRERAVALPEDPKLLRPIDQAFFNPAARFAKQLMPALTHDADKESFRQGWWLREITRRIPTALVAGDDLVYIDPKGKELAIGLVSRELAGRPVDAAAVATAFDALVEELRSHAATLAAFDLAFERPNDTAKLRNRLLEDYRAEVLRRADATASSA